MDHKRSTTIGFERRFNRAFAHQDEDEFVAESIRAGVRPPNMERIVELNRGPFVGAPEPIRPLNGGGAGTVLDVRRAREFAAGHARGAIGVSVNGGGFATKAASPFPPVSAWSSTPGRTTRRSGLRGGSARGIFDLAGYLVGPPSEETMPAVDLDELGRLMEAGRSRCSTSASRTSGTRATSSAAATSRTGSCASGLTTSRAASPW